jgi:hypothetical protein
MADLTVSADVDAVMACANKAAMRTALGFDAAVAANSAVAANTAKTSNATHTGDVTGATALTIAAGAVTTAKLGGDITAAGKALLDDSDASAQRTTLGLGTAATTASTAYATAAQGTKADLAVPSNITGITGADAITNMVSLTAAEYAAIGSPSATTFYVITDA